LSKAKQRISTSTKSLTDKIENDAEKKANKLVEEARKAAEALLEKRNKDAVEKARQDMQYLIDSAKSEAEKIRAIAVEKVEKQYKTTDLSEKEELISHVFESVKTKMKAFASQKDYQDYLERLILEGANALKGGDLEVLLNENDANLRLDLQKTSKTVAADVGKPTTIKVLPGKLSGIGGAAIRSADGKIAVDNSIEGIIERESRKLRLIMAKGLFGA